MDVHKRLLRLAESFAEDVTKDDEDRFTSRVFHDLGLPEPSPQNPEGAGHPAGPARGGLREGETAAHDTATAAPRLHRRAEYTGGTEQAVHG